MAREQVVWVDADGGELNLNDWVNYFCTRDRKGVWAPPYTLQSKKNPLSEGSQFQNVTVGERGVDLPQKIKGRDRAELISILREISQRMNPEKGEGSLRIINDSNTRILFCRSEGIKNLVDKDVVVDLILSFTANDPYWYSDTPESTLIENTSTDIYNFFSASFFPIRLINSTAYALRTIINNGDVSAYPIWTITGPGDSIVLQNLTTNKSLSFTDLVLLEGQILIIDTRIGNKTITVDGSNQFSKLKSLSSLWNLSSGNNDLAIQMANSSLDSKIQMEFTPRYLTP